jgi:uncharacterized phage protein gp47/JayE
MGHFEAETRAAILQRMVNRTVARSTLTDLTEASQLMQAEAAMARAIEKSQKGMIDILQDRDLDNATGEDLDEWGKRILPVVIYRRDKVKATTKVKFGRTNTTGALTVGIGKQVKADGVSNSLIFETTSTATFADGDATSTEADVVATSAGSDHNVDPGTITGFVSKPSGVDTVTNPYAVTNGQDKESDDDYRKRMKAHKLGLARCHVYGVEAAAYGVTDSVSGKTCLFAKAVEDPDNPSKVTIYVDDGAGTAEHTTTVSDVTPTSPASGTAQGGETDIYLQHIAIKEENAFTLKINTVKISASNYTVDYSRGHIKLSSTAYPNGLTTGDTITISYTYYDQLIGEIQKVINGDSADRANYPGYRAMGVMATVKPPQILQQSVTANVTVKTGYSQTDVVNAVKVAISAYINGLTVGEDVIYNELVERIMAVPGVYDVNITAPTSNATVADYQLARISSAATQVS